MTPVWRHRLRRARFLGGGLLAAGIIAVAIVLALGQLLMPLVARYPGEVASLLSARLQRPVSFQSMQGHWQPSGPLLTLHDVGIGGRPGHPALRMPNAEVKFDLGAWFSPSRHLINLRLRGVHVALRRSADGRWHVAGLAAAGHAPQHLSTSDIPGALWLEQSTVDISDAASGRHAQLQLPVVRVSNGGGGLRFSARVQRSGARGTVQVVGRLRPGRGDGEIYVAARQADLGAVLAGLQAHGTTLRRGSGSLRAWLRLKDGRVHSAVLNSDVANLHFETPQGALDVPAWRALVQMHRTRTGMELLYDAADGGAARVAMDGHGPSLRVRAAANRLDLAPLPLVALVPGLPDGLSRWLAGSRMQGNLEQVQLDWSARDGLKHLAARVDGLTLASVGALPGVDGLDGTLRGDSEAISLTLPQQSTVVRMPATFRKPLHLARLQGALVLWRAVDGWHLATPGINVQGDGYDGRLHGQVILPGGGKRPYMDVYASIGHAGLSAAKLFLPLSMPTKTRQWLDQALASGEITAARALVHGSLAHWPFRKHRGRFEAWARVHDVTFDFNKAWPSAQHIDAVADFVDDGMLVTASGGQSMGNKTTRAVAAIPDFRDAQLMLNVEGQGTGGSMIDYVRNSPIGNRHADVLKGLKLSGSGTFDFTMVLPFRHADQFTLGGSAQLHDVGVVDPDWHLQLDHLQGQLHYDAHGMHSDELQAVYRGEPVGLQMSLGAATGDPQVPVSVDAHGRFAIPTLIRGIDVLAPLNDATHGKADFDIGVDVHDGGSGPATTTLHVGSDLRGIAMDLPAPLDKKADASMPLHMTLGLPVAGAPMRLSLGDMRAMARLPSDRAPLSMAVHLGTGDVGSLPAQGVRITGQTPELDVSGWGRRALALAEKGDQSGHGLLDGVDVSTRQALLFGDRFGPLHVRLVPSPDTVTLHVDGPRMLGTATLPVNGVARRGITAQLKRLYWPGGDAAGANSSAAAASPNATATGKAPAPAGTASPAPSPEAATHSIDVPPAAVPPLHFWVGDLRLGKARLGDARFESWPIADGMHIDQLRTHSKDIQLTASGNWTGSVGDNRTHMVIDFGAQNLGRMLSALGFAGLFEGGQTQAHLDATWPGPPSAVSLANMDGTLKVDVSKGRIPEVKPGVGRLFGLMSVTELPRRLSLDFGDVFGKGLGFDSIKGTFRLADGDAYTDGLHIDGAAANITISGRTGIRAKDYDQRVLVIPHIGNSLPIVGAIAGGPVGAAAGLAMQGILGKGLNRAASARYSITGSWQHPKITLIEKKTLPASAASAPIPVAAPVVTPPRIPVPAVPAPAAPGSSAGPAPPTSAPGGAPGL